MPAKDLHRFWSMFAHNHGKTINAHRIAISLAIDSKTVVRFIISTSSNAIYQQHIVIGKRLVK